jgi:hypothetical protein
MAKYDGAPAYFLDEAEGKFGPIYTNKGKEKRKAGEPEMTIYPTKNPKCLKLMVGDADAVLVNEAKSGKCFFNSQYSQDKVVFITKGESKVGPYMRVVFEERKPLEDNAAPSPKATTAPAKTPTSSGSKFGGSRYSK